MTDVRAYHQYQCGRCGFRTRSPDLSEAVDVVRRHEADKHGVERTEDEIKTALRDLELEGLPDNS